MKSIYDKLGDLLNDSIKSGFIQKKISETNSENESENDQKSPPDSDNFEQKKSNTCPGEKKLKDKTFDKKTIQCLETLQSLECKNMDEVRKNYRFLLKKYHPDSVPKYPKMQETAKAKTMKLMDALFYLENAFKE